MYASTLRADDVFAGDGWADSPVEAPAPAAATVQHERGSGFGSPRRPNWIAIGAIVLLHLALFNAFLSMGWHRHHHRRHHRLRIEELKFDIAPPPPPRAQPRPEKKLVETPIVAETPIVQTITTPPPVVASPAPSPPAPPVAAAAPSAPGPVMAVPGPISIGRLTQLPGNPPLKYPMSSKMRHEQGVVRLRIFVGTDGRVQDISIAESSGFDALDKAAMDVVRKWRFQPPTRDGVPAEGVGIFPAAFKLA